jgi:hypothetical protein
MDLHGGVEAVEGGGGGLPRRWLKLAAKGGDGRELRLPCARDVDDEAGNDVRRVGDGQRVDQLARPEGAAQGRFVVLEPGQEGGVVDELARRAVVGVPLLGVRQDHDLRPQAAECLHDAVFLLGDVREAAVRQAQ